MTPITAYHSSDDAELKPRAHLHVGTIEQARMRGGKHLHRIVIQPGVRMPRLRDGGSWNVRTLRRHACRSRVAVYLNRHEGIPQKEFEAARLKGDIERMMDSVFRRLLPSAHDSWIVLDADAIVSIELVNQV